MERHRVGIVVANVHHYIQSMTGDMWAATAA